MQSHQMCCATSILKPSPLFHSYTPVCYEEIREEGGHKENYVSKGKKVLIGCDEVKWLQGIRWRDDPAV
eukprot:7320607-Ditylum_brightwellii.AAC.1